ncbi:universal stress protein [Streptomyces sp. YIM B13518]|uniref:universal stress protein n=1 Tax=Streptomyces sp. YIM B13518 TaxID=3366316 RepID=UPI00369714E6
MRAGPRPVAPPAPGSFGTRGRSPAYGRPGVVRPREDGPPVSRRTGTGPTGPGPGPAGTTALPARESPVSDPVIVGVDGSASSLTAVGVAAREARLRSTSLRIVHGLEPMVHGHPARAEERARGSPAGSEGTGRSTADSTTSATPPSPKTPPPPGPAACPA